MQDEQLIKFSLIICLFGLVMLYLFSNYHQENTIITQDYIELKGDIIKSRQMDNYTFLTINHSVLSDVFINEKINLTGKILIQGSKSKDLIFAEQITKIN